MFWADDKNGNSIYVEDAVSTSEYFCPFEDCKEKLSIRPLKPQSNIARHFWHSEHVVDNFDNKPVCDPDRHTHNDAIQFIIRAVENWKSGTGERPKVVWKCGNKKCRKETEFPLPQEVVSAIPERSIYTATHRRQLDVFLKTTSESLFGIEVYYTSRVQFEKHQDLETLGLIYFEVKANEILQDNLKWRMINSQPDFDLCSGCKAESLKPQTQPQVSTYPSWLRDQGESQIISTVPRKPLDPIRQAQLDARYELMKNVGLPAPRSDNSQSAAKPNNDAASSNNLFQVTQASRFDSNDRNFIERPVYNLDVLSRFKTEAQEIAKKAKQWLPKGFYRYMIEYCLSCRKPFLVFTWPGKTKYDPHKPYFKGYPIPPTIQEQRNKHGTVFWSNTCPRCDAIFGDSYLMFPFNSTTHSDEAFAADMKKIANAWDNRSSRFSNLL